MLPQGTTRPSAPDGEGPPPPPPPCAAAPTTADRYAATAARAPPVPRAASQDTFWPPRSYSVHCTSVIAVTTAACSAKNTSAHVGRAGRRGRWRGWERGPACTTCTAGTPAARPPQLCAERGTSPEQQGSGGSCEQASRSAGGLPHARAAARACVAHRLRGPPASCRRSGRRTRAAPGGSSTARSCTRRSSCAKGGQGHTVAGRRHAAASLPAAAAE